MLLSFFPFFLLATGPSSKRSKRFSVGGLGGLGFDLYKRVPKLFSPSTSPASSSNPLSPSHYNSKEKEKGGKKGDGRAFTGNVYLGSRSESQSHPNMHLGTVVSGGSESFLSISQSFCLIALVVSFVFSDIY